NFLISRVINLVSASPRMQFNLKTRFCTTGLSRRASPSASDRCVLLLPHPADAAEPAAPTFAQHLL
ncbi:MAG: hypothetical protein ACO3FE_17895, partial [Planctomycetaceae bacterium]